MEFLIKIAIHFSYFFFVHFPFCITRTYYKFSQRTSFLILCNWRGRLGCFVGVRKCFPFVFVTIKQIASALLHYLVLCLQVSYCQSNCYIMIFILEKNNYIRTFSWFSCYIFRNAVLIMHGRRQECKWPLLCWVSCAYSSANPNENVMIVSSFLSSASRFQIFI